MKRFGDARSANLSVVLFLRADALQSSANYEEAIAAYDLVIEQFPKSDMVPKCMFMKGVCHLNADRNVDAIASLKAVQVAFPKHALCEDADYWIGMAWSFEGNHQRSRDHLEAHLKRYPAGHHQADSVFRRAFSLFAVAVYPSAISELRDFIQNHLQSPFIDEAWLLLGDALGVVGEIEQAIVAYQSVDGHAFRFHEDGQFKIGKALRVTAQHQRLRAHFAAFVESHSGSPRIAEAVYWIGWSHMAEGNLDRARRIYWDTIAKHGDDPEMVAVEDVLMALPKVYSGDQARAELKAKLRDVSAGAQRDGKSTLLARTAWGEAQFLRQRDMRLAEVALLRASRLLDPRIHSSRMLADCADARLRAGQFQLAEQLYRGLRKWNPRAVEKARAYLGLGRIAIAKNDREAALDWFSRSAKVAVSNDTIAAVLLSKAGVEVDLGRGSDARATLDGLLGSKSVAGRSKARGLLAYGRALELDGDKRKATAYYQRVYVAYGKHRDLVASAYLAQGRALEELSEDDKALEVYHEFAAIDDLSEFEESAQARERIAALTGGKEVLQ